MKPQNLCDVLDSLIEKHPGAQLGIVLKSGGTAEGVAEKVESDPPLYKLTMSNGKQRAEDGRVFDSRLDAWIDGRSIDKVQLMVATDKAENIQLSTGGYIPGEAKLTLS